MAFGSLAVKITPAVVPIQSMSLQHITAVFFRQARKTDQTVPGKNMYM